MREPPNNIEVVITLPAGFKYTCEPKNTPGCRFCRYNGKKNVKWPVVTGQGVLIK